jgi:hypothetical protein
MTMFFRFQKPKKITTLTADSVQTTAGRVMAPSTVNIPGTDIPCACYWQLTEAWKQPARKKGRKMWIPQSARQGCKGFYVEDDTGKIWVPDNGEVLDIRNGWQDAGLMGKKGTQRFVARSIRPGDVIKIRGRVSEAKGAEPADCLVFRPDDKGMVTILQTKKAKKQD